MNKKWIRAAFAASAIYDAALAIAFLFFGTALLNYFGVEKPNHPGYLHFPALLIVVFALMYWRIASDPAKFRDLIPFGIGLKVAYCAVVFYHWLGGGIPSMWIPIAWIDLVFLILCVQAKRSIGPAARPA